MAVNDNRGTQNAQAQPQVQPQAPQSQAPQFGSGNMNWGSLLRSEMPRDRAGESITRVRNFLDETYKAQQNGRKIDVLILDNRTVPQMVIPAIVVVMHESQDKKSPIAFYTMLCAAALDVLRPRTEHHYGNSVEVPSVHSDAYTVLLRNQVMQHLATIYTGRTLSSADGMVIEKDYNPATVDDVYSLAAHAFAACATKLTMTSPDFKELNLAAIGKDEIISFNAKFAGRGSRSITGQPLRDDITIEINAVPAKTNTQQQGIQVEGGIQSGTPIARINGFVELLPVTTPVQPGTYALPGQRFKPRFVASSVDAGLHSPAAIALSLMATFTLFPNQRWLNTFLSRGLAQGEVNYNDIGVLNLVANAYNTEGGGVAIQTDAADFDRKALWDFASRCIDPDPIVSIDIDECGPQTYYTRMLAAAAEGDATSVAAFFNSCDTLTNGGLTRIFREQNKPIGMNPFIDERNRVYLGYFQDSLGNKRDLRTIDYSAALNIYRNNPERAREFVETYLRLDVDPNYRAAARNKFYTEMFPQGFTLTGVARRFTLNMEWWNMFVSAIRGLGVMTRDETEASNSYFTAANANHLISGVANVNGLFTQQGSASNGVYQPTRLI